MTRRTTRREDCMGGAWPHQGGLPGQPHQPMQLPAPGAAAARMRRSGSDQVPACRPACLEPHVLGLPDYAFQELLYPLPLLCSLSGEKQAFFFESCTFC